MLLKGCCSMCKRNKALTPSDVVFEAEENISLKMMVELKLNLLRKFPIIQ